MTEEEAKKKWCPCTIYIFNNVSGNRDADYIFQQGVCNCITTDCMMWVSKPEFEHCSGDKMKRVFVPGGYCGLTKR